VRRDDYGVHEVVVESREHLTEFADATPAVAAWTFQAFRARMLALASDRRLRHVQVFKNNGAAAGASIGHIHSQILATELVPPDVADEWRAAQRWAARHGECLACRCLADELADGRRIVACTERYVAFCPYASRYPFELRIVPRRHAERYEASGDDDLRELAELTLDLLRRLRRELGDVAYNLALRGV
jgi:UDPglucose--hexose-1-phosphate uridylyltransferase